MITEFKLKTAETLGLFQALEQALKEYIGNSYELIRQHVPSDIKYAYTYDDVKKDSLGTLLNKAAKIYPHDDGFIEKAKSLVRKRNDCAHTALLFFADQIQNPEYMTEELEQMRKLHDEVKECVLSFLPKWQELYARVENA